MPTQRNSSREGESLRPQRHRSMTGEVASIVAGNRQTQERVTARLAQVQKEVEDSVGPFGKSLIRLRDAITLAQSGNQEITGSSTPQVRTRAVTRIVTGEGEQGTQRYRTREALSQTPELIMFFVGDNTRSMSSSIGRSGFLNLDDSSTHAKVEERIIGLMGEAQKEFSQNSGIPFRGQTILFGFPERISVVNPDNPYQQQRISVTNRDTGAYLEEKAVVAKAVTQLGEYASMDEQAVLTMQGSDDFRSGPTLLAPPLELVTHQLKENGLTAADFTSGRKAGIVFVASDFVIDDESSARANVEKLRAMGLRVMGLGIGEASDGSGVMRNMRSVFNSDGKNHGRFCQSPEEIVAFVNEQATLEDNASGIDTNAPVVTMQSARRTRTQTQERQRSRYTRE